MTLENDIKLLEGGVYKTDWAEDLVRVIFFDNVQVFYEVWWEHCNDWSNRSNLNSKSYYYRTSFNHFVTTSVFLRTEPLTESEKKVHRPDLPFCIFRNTQLSWTDKVFSSIISYENYLSSKSINTKEIPGLNIPEIFLVPYGLKGEYKKSVLIKAMNGTNFSGIELLWHAQNAQAPYINGESETGIGIYRLGFETGIPSFYIGGYYDSAGFLKVSEI